MQQLGICLDNLGYNYSRHLYNFNSNQLSSNYTETFTLEPLCHYYDVLIHDSGEKSELYKQFQRIISSSNSYYNITPSISKKREFVQNNERRKYLLNEFINTEANYLNSLRTFVTLIVEPLRQRSKDRHRAIIGQYECANIFMNIGELVQVTNDFYQDLVRYNPDTDNFGDLCLSHLRKFSCYNKFLLGVHNAQIINEKQMKNPHYVHFLEKVNTNKNNGNQTVYDYLALPIQRVGRYTMYFKEIIKHTTDDHKDLPGLYGSLLKAEEIANMTEEVHTQLMKIFRQLLQAILYCPESLISFQRRFISYLDIAEMDPITLKPTQPVTLFLFSDKLMIVRRPSYDVDGLDACGLDQRIYEGSEKTDFIIRKKANSGKLKFIGWTSLDDIDIREGGLESDNLKSFVLMYNNTSRNTSIDNTDQATQRSLEAYFQDELQGHYFSLTHSGGNLINREYFQTIDKTKSFFIYQYGKLKNEKKQSDELIKTCYCQWNNHHFYTNIYSTLKYSKIENKNDTILVFVENNMVKQIETILSNCFITPNIVAFIVPHEKEDNYEFAIRSKWAAIMGNNENQKLSKMTLIQVKQINEAQDQLFGNLLACNRDLSRESQLVKMNAYQRPTNSRFSFVKHEIIRKKSISTFRLFSALGIHQQRRQHVKPSNNIFINRRSRTTTARKPITTRVTSAAVNNESNSNDLDNHNSSIYRSCLSSINSSNLSIKSQYSEESINKLISPLNSLEKQSTNRRSLSLSPSPLVSSQYQSTFYRLANASLLTNNQEQRGLNPSFHPTRTASYELQSAADKRGSEELINLSFMNNNNKSMLEEDDDNQSSSLREPTPAMIGPGSEFSTIHSQQSTSTISTFNHQRLSPLSRNKILDHHSLPSFINRPSLSDLTIPITTVSSSLDDYQHNVSTYIGSDTAADNKKPFESDLYLKLEEKNKTILVLTELVQKKEEEIEVLKADLDDYVSELGSVCDKFNRELDEIADIYTTDHQQPSRPSHPSPDMQLKKKLDMTLRERNQWQLKATELEYQLRALLLNQHHQLYYNSILNQINSTMKPRLQDETILTKKK